jgi:type VI protein secretion system component Hcp
MAQSLFLDIKDSSGQSIQGGSNDKEFHDKIEILSFSFGGPAISLSDEESKKKTSFKVTQKIKGSVKQMMEQVKDKRKGPGKGGNHEETVETTYTLDDSEHDTFSFRITKDFDYSSPDLLQSYAKNLGASPTAFQSATIYCRIDIPGPAQLVIYQLTFQNVWVVNYEMSVTDAGSTPDERIEFVFTKCTMAYTPQMPDGTAGTAMSPVGWDFQKKERYQ